MQLTKSLILGLSILLALCLTSSAEMRTFTSPEGKKMSAEVLSVLEESATLRKKGGRPFTIALSKLSEDDQEYLREWAKVNKNKLGPVKLGVKARSGRFVTNNNWRNGYEIMETLEFEVKVQNNGNDPIKDAKVKLYVVSSDVDKKSINRITQVQTYKLDVIPGITKKFSAPKYTQYYTDRAKGSYYRKGYKYNGYVLIIENSDGETIYSSGIPSTVTKYIESVKKLGVGDLTTKKFVKK